MYDYTRTSEILRVWFLTTAMKRVVIFVLVKGLAFNFQNIQHPGRTITWGAIKRGLPVLEEYRQNHHFAGILPSVLMQNYGLQGPTGIRIQWAWGGAWDSVFSKGSL